MSDEHFQREARYQASLSIAKALLRQGLISQDEYKTVDAFLLDKYRPVLGSLFAHGR